jgi:hypothetical protein
MAKRRTIGKDPLSQAHGESLYSAEIVPMPIAGGGAAKDHAETAAEAAAVIANEPVIVVDGKARRVVGGRLEILGGDLGTGSRVIWPSGPTGRIGFVAPTGRAVDLGQELDVVSAWPDHTERRYLSAAGWAWVLASLGGIVGLVAGGGLRLLEPRRMMVKMLLSDGSQLVARTDSVTVAGLKAFADSRSTAKASPKSRSGD